jgi:hypothetical protein
MEQWIGRDEKKRMRRKMDDFHPNPDSKAGVDPRRQQKPWLRFKACDAINLRFWSFSICCLTFEGRHSCPTNNPRSQILHPPSSHPIPAFPHFRCSQWYCVAFSSIAATTSQQLQSLIGLQQPWRRWGR